MQIKVVNLEGDASAQEATLNAFTKDFWDIVSIVHDGYTKGKVTAYLRKNQMVAAPNTREGAPMVGLPTPKKTITPTPEPTKGKAR